MSGMGTGIVIEEPRQKVFLVGVGRSGTSLLQAMLNAHSEVFFLPETGFFRKYVVTGKISQAVQQHGMSGLTDCLAKDARIKRLGPDLIGDIEKQGLLKDSADFEVADKLIYEFLHKSLHEGLHERITGDKDPKLIEHIDVLKSLWPTSKVIHIYRDPRDVLLSKKKAKWSQSQSNFGRLIANVAQFSMAAKAENKFGRSEIHTVRYESLINNPQSVLREICEWLDIKFEDRMLAHQKSAQELVFKDELQWKSEVLGPVLPSNTGKWQKELSTFEAEWTAQSCAQAMEAGSYESRAGNSAINRIKVLPLSLLVVCAAKLYTLYRSTSNCRLLRRLGN